MGDFVSAHASGEKCELAVPRISRVSVRDQMRRKRRVESTKALVCQW
jgi:hypothetical protein